MRKNQSEDQVDQLITEVQAHDGVLLRGWWIIPYGVVGTFAWFWIIKGVIALVRMVR